MSSRNILSPVVISNNRLRGNSTGAMVDDGPGEENLSLLRAVLKQETIDAGVEHSGFCVLGNIDNMETKEFFAAARAIGGEHLSRDEIIQVLYPSHRKTPAFRTEIKDGAAKRV